MAGDRPELKPLAGFEGACLDITGIDRYVRGEGSPEFRQGAAAHLASCPRCSTELDLYRGFQSGQAGEASDVEWVAAALRERSTEIFRAKVVTPDFRKRKPLAPAVRRGALALAAAVVLMAAGLYVLMRTAPEIPIADPGGPSELRSDSIALIAPQGDLTRAPERFEWKTHPRATRYRVLVLEVDGNVLWSGETPSSPLPLPRELSRIVVPGKTLRWRVLAFDDTGTELASSGGAAFRLLPGAQKVN